MPPDFKGGHKTAYLVVSFPFTHKALSSYTSHLTKGILIIVGDKRLTSLYTHELNKEIQSISGWYSLDKEERITHRGKEYLYLVGDGVLESSCCGTGGCHYAVVPGSVVSWKSGTNENGFPTSVVEPVTDKMIEDELREILSKKEGVSQVQFW